MTITARSLDGTIYDIHDADILDVDDDGEPAIVLDTEDRIVIIYVDGGEPHFYIAASARQAHGGWYVKSENVRQDRWFADDGVCSVGTDRNEAIANYLETRD